MTGRKPTGFLTFRSGFSNTEHSPMKTSPSLNFVILLIE
jgi:hypothetical protein